MHHLDEISAFGNCKADEIKASKLSLLLAALKVNTLAYSSGQLDEVSYENLTHQAAQSVSQSNLNA